MESKGNPKNKADKKQPQDNEEELKDQPQNLITTIPTQDDTEKLMKDLMDRFANVKFTQDEKDHLTYFSSDFKWGVKDPCLNGLKILPIL